MTQYKNVSLSQPLYKAYEENRIVGAAEKKKITYLQLSEYIYIF